MQLVSCCFSNRRSPTKQADASPPSPCSVKSAESFASSSKPTVSPIAVQTPHQRPTPTIADADGNCSLEHGKQKLLAFVNGSKDVVLSTGRAIGRAVMGVSSTAAGGHSEPENVETTAARLLSLLTQRPNRMSDMLRVIAILSECGPNEKQEFIRLGVLTQLLKEIESFSHLNQLGNRMPTADEKRKTRGWGGRRPSTSHSTTKGVGYGRGSTKSRWDMERTVEERIAQEEHLMWLLCALTTFLCGDSIKLAELTPDFELPREQPIATVEAADELANSVLLELIAYHLANDSVFDISNHIDFYQALMEATTALAFIPLFLPRLVTPKDSESRSIAKDVLPRFRATLNQYLNSIRGQQSPDSGFIDFCRRSNDMIEVIKKLAQRYEQRLPPEKRVKTAVIGHRVLRTAAGLSDQQPLELGIPATSLYVDLLQPLQITTQRLIGDDGKPIHSFAFKKELRSVNPFASSLKERTKRIAKELASLHSGLPLSASSSIFLCVDEARCDVLKVLITGPSKTPYENGLFEFDVFFPSNYPNSPPKVSFLTTGAGQIRFNPNLYADGKICLSLLNTWEGRQEEKWTPVSSLLQVLVSIQGLIFVENPYFNEPGFEKFANSPKGQDFSTRYNSHIQMATFTYAISQMAKNPPVYFKDVIRRHLWLKREAIVEQAERWLNETLLDAPPMGIENDPDSGSSDSYMNPIVQRQNVQKLISQLKEMQNPLESQEFL